MTDLSEYDRAIVEAAEQLAKHYAPFGPLRTSGPWPLGALWDAVQAKREAQLPKCIYNTGIHETGLNKMCGKTAVVREVRVSRTEYYCADHRVTVTDLG